MTLNTQSFIFYEDGFSCIFDTTRKFYKWMEIEKIVAYKIDLQIEDEICLELFFKNYKLLFTEETIGWNEFLTKMLQNFPKINPNWQLDIVKPTFARKETILFSNT